MTRTIGAKETAQIIRKQLREQFPGVKFSVKMGQGGGNIYVRWTDGPAETRVNTLVRSFSDIHYDGMYENTNYTTSEWEGEEVQFLVNYVVCQRTTSWAFVEAVLGCYERYHGKTELHIEGVAEHACIRFDYLHQTDHHYMKELLECTDAQDMHDAYGALQRREAERRASWEAGAEERQRQQEEDDRIYQEQERIRQKQEAEAERLRQREQARKQEEQEAANKAYRERQAMREGQRAILTNSYTARMFLGVPMTASENQIKGAFTHKVKEVADGRGGYTMDMAFLVAVKEKALSND